MQQSPELSLSNSCSIWLCLVYQNSLPYTHKSISLTEDSECRPLLQATRLAPIVFRYTDEGMVPPHGVVPSHQANHQLHHDPPQTQKSPGAFGSTIKSRDCLRTNLSSLYLRDYSKKTVPIIHALKCCCVTPMISSGCPLQSIHQQCHVQASLQQYLCTWHVDSAIVSLV